MSNLGRLKSISTHVHDPTAIELRLSFTFNTVCQRFYLDSSVGSVIGALEQLEKRLKQENEP